MNIGSVGKHIREYRVLRKLNQDDLAEKTGLSPNYIGMIERGEKIPSLETFISILNALEISADMVLVDVVDAGYAVKNSILTEKLDRVAPEDRAKIYDVVDTMLRHSKRIKP